MMGMGRVSGYDTPRGTTFQFNIGEVVTEAKPWRREDEGSVLRTFDRHGFAHGRTPSSIFVQEG
jgi:hypothetical protein